MVIKEGDVYWVQMANPIDVESAIPHPFVVIPDDVLNPDRGTTVTGCFLTSNIKRVAMPGNVLLEGGEANLPKPSVVEVSKVAAIEKTRLGAYIGSLSKRRVDQIRAGIRFVQTYRRDDLPE